MTRLLKIRDSHVHYDAHNDFWETSGIPPTGAKVYVIQRSMLAGTSGYQRDMNHVKHVFRTTPGRKNMSHEECVKGWLGTTDNIDYYALGYYEVVGGSSTHIHLKEIDANE